MAYNYTINGETVAAKGVKLTGDGETRTLVDTRSIHADVIGGNVKIRIDPDTPSDMTDDTEIGTSRAITATEMDGAVTLGYNPSTQKVHGYVNGGDAVSRTLEQLNIPAVSSATPLGELIMQGESELCSLVDNTTHTGVLSFTVPVENKTRTYMICANGSNLGTKEIVTTIITLTADNNMDTAKWASKIWNTSSVLGWVTANPAASTIAISIDGSDMTITITAPTSMRFWDGNASNKRDFRVYRINDLLGGV